VPSRTRGRCCSAAASPAAGRSRRLRYVARAAPLAPSQRQEIGRTLTAATGVHPLPQPLPPAWIGQLNQREPQPYVRDAAAAASPATYLRYSR
jgi:hypothetical protein